MTKVTQQQIEVLVKIQQIDIEVAKIKSLLNGLPERMNRIEQRLQEFMGGIESDEAGLKEMSKKYRTYESDVQINLAKIARSEERLRSVKTNKEYQSSLKEIEDLKAINSRIEDEMLDYLEHIETAEKNLKERKARHDAIVAESTREKDSINRDAEDGKQKMARLEAERGALAVRLDSELQAIFNRIKAKQANGVAIVEVRDAVCQGCNMNIPAQMYNELQRCDSLKNCPSCERIIYWQDNDQRLE